MNIDADLNSSVKVVFGCTNLHSMIPRAFTLKNCCLWLLRAFLPSSGGARILVQRGQN